LKLGRVAEARAVCDRALAAREAQVRSNGDVLEYRGGLAEILLRDGQLRAGQADFAGAAAAWQRACSVYDGMSPLTPERTFYRA
jgi:hypothetical protein